MKKKILIGALALASVFTLASATDGNSTSSETERRFWGSQIVGVQTCVQSGHAIDGSPTYTVTYEVEYYILWKECKQQLKLKLVCHIVRYLLAVLLVN
ncbi:MULTISPECIES: hypothetical protein [Chryseobacterium]|uniref:Secreted protein n=1 Tax=Candidatus Chryseobacterium massiliense TaxID=204089 RepID=A0A3D9B6P3_9FLAO|nr:MULTISPECIES: hypothetical protein [Chryseobacterium]REC49305.1 hypothetical protein DRF68_10465 [Candidatus Chryseobacterium massiliae]